MKKCGPFEEIKRRPLKLVISEKRVYKDFKTIAKFDDQIIELWDRDFCIEIMVMGKCGKYFK